MAGSESNTPAMLKPWSANVGDDAIAEPSRPAPISTMLCWPEVRRILRISVTRKSMLYPTPRLPNLPKPDRSRRIWVAFTFVYSPISCEEIESRPIFFACVSTCR